MEVREINIHLKRNLTKWQKFLRFNGIEVFSEKETSSIDKTFVWEENGEILATGSIAGNVLKYIAICSKVQGHGETFNSLVSKLENEAAMMGRFHLFVFTKPQYSQSFQYVGFHELAKVEQGTVLESGTPDIIGGVRIGLSLLLREKINHYYVLEMEDKINQLVENVQYIAIKKICEQRLKRL